MNLRLLSDGQPGQHLGISHTLKHYLSPREMWEDVSEAVEPQHRPRAASERLPELSPPAWQQWGEPSPALSEAWYLLRSTYRQGYAKLLALLAETLDDPGSPNDTRWVRRGRAFACHAGDGVIIKVEHRHDTWQLRTAYRPFDFKLDRHECPPRDEVNVSVRRKLAEYTVERRVTAWRGQEDDQ